MEYLRTVHLTSIHPLQIEAKSHVTAAGLTNLFMVVLTSLLSELVIATIKKVMAPLEVGPSTITCLEQACELAPNDFLFFFGCLYTPSFGCPGVIRSTLQHRCLPLRPHIRRPLSFSSTPPPISVALLRRRYAAAANITTPPPPPLASSIVIAPCRE